MCADEKSPPIAIASRDVIVQPGQTVTLSGIESLALGDAQINQYQWEQLSGPDDFKMEVQTAQCEGAGLKTGRGHQWEIRVSDSDNGEYLGQRSYN